MIEELGELSHGVLKKLQGIRGTTDDHQDEIEDACADIVIFSLDYCNMNGFDLYDALSASEPPTENMMRDGYGSHELIQVMRIGKLMGKLCEKAEHDKQTVDDVVRIIWQLEMFCVISKLNLWKLVYETWERVSQRDWKKHPKTGRSDEQPPPQPITAERILEDGIAILAQRGAQYNGEGGRERHMAQITDAFFAMTGKRLTPVEGWLFMVCLKGVRAGAGGGLDTFGDGANYFALAGEEKSRS
jgi:hypothetical protein